MVSKCKRCFVVFVGPLNIEAPAREVTNNSLTDFDLPSVSKGKHFAISISFIKGCNIMPVCIVTFPKRQKANIPDLEKLNLFGNEDQEIWMHITCCTYTDKVARSI